MIIYSNENVEIEDDGTLHILRDTSRNDVLARVKADDYGGYIVVRDTIRQARRSRPVSEASPGQRSSVF